MQDELSIAKADIAILVEERNNLYRRVLELEAEVSRLTKRALDTCPRCEGVGSYCDYIGVRQCGLCGGTGKCQ